MNVNLKDQVTFQDGSSMKIEKVILIQSRIKQASKEYSNCDYLLSDLYNHCLNSKGPISALTLKKWKLLDVNGQVASSVQKVVLNYARITDGFVTLENPLERYPVNSKL